MDIITLKNSSKKKFEKIIEKKQNIAEKMNKFSALIAKSSDVFLEISKNTNKSMHNNIYLGIDTYNFQNKQIEFTHNYFKQQYLFIFNRIYGDNYKIFKHIKNFTEEKNKKETIIDISYAKYKDLEIYKEFDFKTTIDLNNAIYVYINFIYDTYINKKKDIDPIYALNEIGCNLNYYINEESTNISIYKEKILLYISYLNTCNHYHNQYLSDLLEYIDYSIEKICNNLRLNLNTDYRFLDMRKDVKSILEFIDASCNTDIFEEGKENIIIETEEIKNIDDAEEIKNIDDAEEIKNINEIETFDETDVINDTKVFDDTKVIGYIDTKIYKKSVLSFIYIFNFFMKFLLLFKIIRFY